MKKIYIITIKTIISNNKTITFPLSFDWLLNGMPGDPAYAADSSQVQAQLCHVRRVCGSLGAFAALKADGSIVTWGCKEAGMGEVFLLNHHFLPSSE